MQINVTGRHREITEAIRGYCVGKLEHALADVPRLTHVHVVLAVEKHRQQAEIVLQALHHTMEARAESDDLYASIDAAVEKVRRQVDKQRDRIADHKGQVRPDLGGQGRADTWPSR